MRTRLPALFTHEGGADPKDLRESLLRLILRVSISLGFLAFVPSVILDLRQGLYGIAALDALALSTVSALYRLDRVPFRWRAIGVCLVYYTLAVGLLVSVGSISQIYLFGFSIVTGLLFGRRTGLGAALLSSVSLFAVGALGLAAPELTIRNTTPDLVGWLVITINFGLVNVILTLAVGTVLDAGNAALRRAITNRDSFDRERILLRTLLDALPDVVFSKDRAGRFVNYNAAAVAFLGADRSDAVAGRTAFDFLPPEIAATHEADDREVMAGAPVVNREERSVDREGRPAWYLTTKVPLRDAEGGVIGLIGVSRDITIPKGLEAQLRQAQKMEAIGELARGVAHDFNNLLSVVLSYSELVLDDLAVGDPLRESVEEIRRAGLQAAHLTRQLLTFSRQQVVQPEQLDLNGLITGLRTRIDRILGEGITSTLLPAPGLGRVRADPGSIEQVVMSLIVNAREAMPEGGALIVETADIVIDQTFVPTHLGVRPGTYVSVSVTDTGVGMDAATSARIFEPFFTTKEKVRGPGLGLSSAFGIVQQSGGALWVESEPGRGATFRVYLPRDDEPAAAVAPDTLR